MSCYYESEPCKEQKEFMENLGFVLRSTTDKNRCFWALEDHDGITFTVHVTLDLEKRYKPELSLILKMVVMEARRQGEDSKAKVIRDVLGIKDRCACEL